ncbi:MAG: hypothetical protein LBG28_00185 [Tannerella sp.]|jgi:hypothetical protein|nr:hypothetical protein [Tannerella sp.]
MNDTFNAKRFGFVFRKDMLENGKQYTRLFLTMLGVMTILFLWQSFDYYPSRSHYRDFNVDLLTSASILFAILGILFVSTFMSPMSDKTKRIAYLTCPASHFEKALSRWLIVTAGYIVAFFVALWIADALRVGICATRYPDIDVKFLDLGKLFHPGDGFAKGYLFDNASVFICVLSAYLLIQSLFILGATFFEKAAFVKTFIAVSVIVLAFIFICRWTILLSYGDFYGFEQVLDSFIDGNEITPKQAAVAATSVMSVFTLTNWTLAFCKLRESEITQRL